MDESTQLPKTSEVCRFCWNGRPEMGDCPHCGSPSLPGDYEMCGDCGFDHTYEPRDSARAHDKSLRDARPQTPHVSSPLDNQDPHTFLTDLVGRMNGLGAQDSIELKITGKDESGVFIQAILDDLEQHTWHISRAFQVGPGPEDMYIKMCGPYFKEIRDGLYFEVNVQAIPQVILALALS